MLVPGSVRRFLLIALAVTGCARAFRPPAQLEITLAGKVATYRAYAPKTVCMANSEFVPTLKAELVAMNELLSAFLRETSASPQGTWTPAQLEVLESAPSVLEPALDVHEGTLREASQCLFDETLNLTPVMQGGLDLVRQSRLRLAEGPGVLRANSDLRVWKEQQERERDQEKSSWCPAQAAIGDTTIFFATVDETGRAEWLFCNGTRVIGEPGRAPAYSPSREGPSLPPSSQKAFLRSAAKYPQSNVRRAPSMPTPLRPP